MKRQAITKRDIAEALHKKGKARAFTTDDVMRVHWNHNGSTAREWARGRVKQMRKLGLLVVVIPSDNPVDGDRRKRLYRFTESALQEWGIA
jgi:hypothetical protein